MEIFRLIQSLENDNSTKLSRLLVLIYELSGEKHSKGVESVNKLAKLNFLMTSPILLRRIVYKPNAANKIVLSEHEINSIESKLIFYRYNPWDTGFRKLINILVAMGLTEIDIKDIHYNIVITQKGIQVVHELYKFKGFDEYRIRGKLINTYLGSYSDNYLKKFFNEKFPELSTLNSTYDEHKI